MREGPRFTLDRSIWCTGRAHLRQGVTVHFGIVGDSVSTKRHASPQDNGVPSPVEWDCGTISSSSETALMARLTGPDWIDELPWVLLGIRTVPKEDLGCSSAEMVYGAPLTVPGDFLPRGQDTDDVAHFLPRLRETVRKLAPRPPVPHGTKPSSVPTAFRVRQARQSPPAAHAALRGPLQGVAARR